MVRRNFLGAFAPLLLVCFLVFAIFSSANANDPDYDPYEEEVVEVGENTAPPEKLPIECRLAKPDEEPEFPPIRFRDDRTVFGALFGVNSVDSGIRPSGSIYAGIRDHEVDLDSDFRGHVEFMRGEIGLRSVYPGSDESNQNSLYLHGRGYHLSTFGNVQPNDGTTFKGGAREAAYIGADFGMTQQYNIDGPYGGDTSDIEMGGWLGCELGVLNARPNGDYVSAGFCLQGRTSSYDGYEGDDSIRMYELLGDNFEAAPGFILRGHFAREASDWRYRNSRPLSTDFDLRFLRGLDSESNILDLGVWHDVNPHLTCVVKLSNDNINTGIAEPDDIYGNTRLTFGLEYSR